MAHVTEKKSQAVENLAKLIEQYPIIGVVDMQTLPAGNLAQMRKKLRKSVLISMTKKRLIAIALKSSKKKNVTALEPFLKGMPALLFTKDNPFTLFKTLKKNQSPAPIKPGQIAPHDIIVPAGPTSFPPGPIIGELGQLGIKGGVEGGKVVIKMDATLAHEGQAVSEKAAAFLQRMNIQPMRIGLKLVAVYENGDVIKANVLDIDQDKFVADLQKAALDARTISLERAILTADTRDALLARAHYNAAGLALEANLLTDENAKNILAKAYYQARGVAKYLPEGDRPQEAQEDEAPAAHAATEEKKDDKKSEESAAAGLGSLFG